MKTVASLHLHIGEWVFGAHTHTTIHTPYRSPWEGLLEVAHSRDSIILLMDIRVDWETTGLNIRTTISALGTGALPPWEEQNS